MMSKSILFFLINMNLGGTEKSFLNLINSLPEDVIIDLLLLENKGQLLERLPARVNLRIIEKNELVNFLIENNLPGYTLLCFKKMDFIQMCRAIYFYFRSKFSDSSDFKFETIANKLPTQSLKYDIAVAYAGPHQFISSYIAKKVTAKKKIQWIHFDIEKIISNYNFGRKFYPYFDKIFCVSQSAKEIFLRNFPEFEGKTEVFHNIISAPEIKKLAEEGESYPDEYDGMRILTVGRFTKEKGQLLIPEVVTKLKSELFAFRWYFVGDGKEKENVQNKSMNLDLLGDIIFLGEKENPYPFMKNCDIYVQPSLHEGFGITVEEAKVFNKPIVLTNFASAKDLVENQKTGLITDISSEGIYKAVRTLILNAELRKEFSHNLSKRKLLSDYDVSKILN